MSLKNDVVFELTGAPKGVFAGGKWTFRRGEQWVVMGPNGSGKSCLAALLSGEAQLRGVGLTFAGDVEDRVALVTFSQQQEQASGHWLQARWHSLKEDEERTVRRFLSFDEVNEINPFEVRVNDQGERRAFARRFREVTRAFNLGPLLRRLMVQLSNGEMRRVLLSRALLKSPKLLVLDDPFAGLDSAMRARLQEVLERMADEGLPMVMMVRHEDEVPACATHRLLLEELRIIARRRLPRKGRVAAAVLDQPLQGTHAAHSSRAGILSPEPVIELCGVTVKYGRRVVLDKLGWTVRAGERWLVVGPNGSGKTTLLSLITGDNPAAYANDVRVFGRARESGASLWPVRRRIGQVSPEIQCYFDVGMNCLDAVLSGRFNSEGTAMRPTRAVREAARGWLHELGLKGVEKVRFGELSAGRQRLVLLARAMLPRPDLLLLDEPCLNLDAEARRQVLAVLERMLRMRRDETVVCVAHRADDVPRGFQHVLRLNGEAATSCAAGRSACSSRRGNSCS